MSRIVDHWARSVILEGALKLALGATEQEAVAFIQEWFTREMGDAAPTVTNLRIENGNVVFTARAPLAVELITISGTVEG